MQQWNYTCRGYIWLVSAALRKYFHADRAFVSTRYALNSSRRAKKKKKNLSSDIYVDCRGWQTGWENWRSFDVASTTTMTTTMTTTTTGAREPLGKCERMDIRGCLSNSMFSVVSSIWSVGHSAWITNAVSYNFLYLALVYFCRFFPGAHTLINPLTRTHSFSCTLLYQSCHFVTKKKRRTVLHHFGFY